ncbi:hypothetical protein [Virgisporangium aurantiacum]|uniref:Uncharacterized protein n=1 Tax=Virgisporangium aurantiacum TaxID=175570 RepID=A0A8J3ZE10_9ACTN|nr:hypothetical protein [Virgisporangium aurantiacum]GIJ62449.1 hypothetical protein Vau01_099650 [Virgisporangium aurantiacum]
MSSPLYLNVETDGLTEAMQPVQDHVRTTLKKYSGTIDGIGSVVDAVKTDEDTKILQQSNAEMEAVRMLLVSLQGLAAGDETSIALLAANFNFAEDQAIDQASGWNGRH